MHDEPQSTAEYFHERTKYHPETIGSIPGMDPSLQPTAFKEYPGAERIEMRDALPFKPFGVPGSDTNDNDEGNPLAPVSRLLFCCNGVTAVAQMGSEKHYYRAAPSAGALYPTEIYIAVRNHEAIPSGIYNFHVRDQALQAVEPKGLNPEGDELFRELSKATLEHVAFENCDICIFLTTIFWRSAWRYGERAYRRCMLDTGHVLGNLAAYAPHEGLCAIPLSGFVDEEVNNLLGLNSSKESVCAVVPLVTIDDAEDVVESNDPVAFRSSPYAALVRPEDNQLLSTMVQQTVVTRNEALLAASSRADATPLTPSSFRFSPRISISDLQDGPPELIAELMPTILRRRSTRVLSGESLKRKELVKVLEFAYRYDLAHVEHGWRPHFFDLTQLQTWVVVQNVEGLQAGTYHYQWDCRELQLMERGDFREQTHFVSMQQNLSQNAAAIVFHTCDLRAAVDQYGNRAYRVVHLDAGHLGQRMNIAAIALGLGVSGIAGFFDEYVNALLAIPAHEACVYMTCLGRPA